MICQEVEDEIVADLRKSQPKDYDVIAELKKMVKDWESKKKKSLRDL